MGNPDFSETQFSYGISRELEDGHGPLRPIGPPYFPTRHDEQYLGFDVAWLTGSRPLFLQFKRSKKLKDSRAIDDQWDYYQDTFYRFPVKTSNDRGDWDQHERLVALGGMFEDTFYVAPQFVDWSEYTRYSASRSLNLHSVFLRCGSAPTPFDDQSHYICHRPQDSYGVFFSESEDPPRVDALGGFEELLGYMLDSGPAAETFDELRDSFSEARATMVESFDSDIELDGYDPEEPFTWMRAQQRFFFETMGTVLHFMTVEDH